MKKFLFLFLLIAVLTGCSSKDEPSQKFNVAALNGPTGIGMVNMMEDNKHNFTLVSEPNQIVTGLTNGEFDIASIPSNLASVLYNKNQDISVVAINTLGVLYIVENGNTVNSISDLNGKTIFATGKGATPEFVLNYLLEKANIKDNVNIEFKTEHGELAALLAQGKGNLALLPQPFVTVAMEKNKDLKIALDLNEEWEKLTNNNMITGVLVVKNDVIKNHKKDLDMFLQDYKKSIDLANSDIEKTAELTEKYNILPKDVAKKAIPYCNIVYIDNKDLKNLLSSYYQVLFEQNPKSIGGNLPDEKFYYQK